MIKSLTSKADCKISEQPECHEELHVQCLQVQAVQDQAVEELVCTRQDPREGQHGLHVVRKASSSSLAALKGGKVYCHSRA